MQRAVSTLAAWRATAPACPAAVFAREVAPFLCLQRPLTPRAPEQQQDEDAAPPSALPVIADEIPAQFKKRNRRTSVSAECENVNTAYVKKVVPKVPRVASSRPPVRPRSPSRHCVVCVLTPSQSEAAEARIRAAVSNCFLFSSLASDEVRNACPGCPRRSCRCV
jgi:hypothetical protein